MKRRRCWSGSRFEGSEERRNRAEKLERFIRDRDEMLLKCSVEELRAFVESRAGEWYDFAFVETFLEAPELIQESVLHKMIVSVTTVPVKQRQESMTWLLAHGFSGYGL